VQIGIFLNVNPFFLVRRHGQKLQLPNSFAATAVIYFVLSLKTTGLSGCFLIFSSKKAFFLPEREYFT